MDNWVITVYLNNANDSKASGSLISLLNSYTQGERKLIGGAVNTYASLFNIKFALNYGVGTQAQTLVDYIENILLNNPNVKVTLNATAFGKSAAALLLACKRLENYSTRLEVNVAAVDLVTGNNNYQIKADYFISHTLMNQINDFSRCSVLKHLLLLYFNEAPKEDNDFLLMPQVNPATCELKVQVLPGNQSDAQKLVVMGINQLFFNHPSGCLLFLKIQSFLEEHDTVFDKMHCWLRSEDCDISKAKLVDKKEASFKELYDIQWARMTSTTPVPSRTFYDGSTINTTEEKAVYLNLEHKKLHQPDNLITSDDIMIDLNYAALTKKNTAKI